MIYPLIKTMFHFYRYTRNAASVPVVYALNLRQRIFPFTAALRLAGRPLLLFTINDFLCKVID